MGGIILKSGIDFGSAFSDLSVVIITLNEAATLPALLTSIPKNAEIVILDSHSSDQTREIASSLGCRVETRVFDNYASQKNYAMSLASRPWTLCLDADELPDDALWASVGEVLRRKSDGKFAYDLPRKLIFLGKKMRFGRTQDKVTRLFRSHTASYQNEIHETLVLSSDTKTIKLKGTLWHKSYRDLEDYFSKFNRYTTLMALSRWRENKTAPNPFIMAIRLPSDFVLRYFVKLGFLDGWRGFLWAALSSFYSLIKYAKLKEMSEKVL